MLLCSTLVYSKRSHRRPHQSDCPRDLFQPISVNLSFGARTRRWGAADRHWALLYEPYIQTNQYNGETVGTTYKNWVEQPTNLIAPLPFGFVGATERATERRKVRWERGITANRSTMFTTPTAI